MAPSPSRAAMLPLLLLALVSAAAGNTELKYNCGSGTAEGDYKPDPEAFLSGTTSVYISMSPEATGVIATHRYSMDVSFAYTFPVQAGEYEVDLLFAEIYPVFLKANGRKFNVAVQDKEVLSELDVFDSAGPYTKLVKALEGIAVTNAGLKIEFSPGTQQNAMVSGIAIRRADGKSITLSADEALSDEGTSTGDGSEDLQGFDHQSHSVAGGPYSEVDFNNDGTVSVTLDGELSHSHYFNPATGETGNIKKYEWLVAGKVVSEEPKYTGEFSIGSSPVTLRVTDQTGDVAEAVANVDALPASAGGSYCYYYPGADSLPLGIDTDPKPEEGHTSSSIDFPTADDFPYTGKSDDAWAARCITVFQVATAKSVSVGLDFSGSAALYVDGKLAFEGAASGAKTIDLAAGGHPIEVLYYKKGDSSSLMLTLDSKVATPSQLSFESADIIPTISSISTESAQPGGGGEFQIIGTGYFNEATVKVGSAFPQFVKISATELVVTIPSQEEAGAEEVKVIVANSAGTSNFKTLKYGALAPKAVDWEQTYLKNKDNDDKFGLTQISSITVGPDAKYYMGSLAGVVHQVVAGKDLKVTDSCKSESLGDSRAVLGVAFNPTSAAVKLYATSNTLYWNFGGPFKGDPKGWANGNVESLEPGCGCLCVTGKVITGLPVSNHDHAVNGLTFLGGDMLLAVGGFTNGGHNTPGNKLGAVAANPLSGAIVIAKLSKGDFDGKITYDQYEDPEKATQTGGLDVSVYASGLRNSFGVAVTTGGKVWATDNGPNTTYGKKSESCTTESDDPSAKDELNYIVEGEYYGHPNRNRGECVFGAGKQPAATFESSTDGITEYSSNAFSGSLKGELICSKYSVGGGGKSWRFAVDESGNVKNQVQMTAYSGLSITNGIHGELVMPKVGQGHIAVLKPKYPAPTGPMMIAVTPRRGKGGQTVLIAGENFTDGATAKFGSALCTDLEVLNANELKCKTPAGSGVVSVVVTTSDGTSEDVPGGDFIYM